MFWGGPQDHFGMLAGFQKAVIFICICCLGVARWNYFSNMWDTRGATCVVGGRVGMDETHQVNIHFNWDNLSLFSLLSSLFSLYLFLISILFPRGRVDATPGRLPPLSHFRPENLHSVRGYPKKVEKTSSKNTTFENSEHPYRTCGSRLTFSLLGSSPTSVLSLKTYHFAADVP